MAVSGFNPAELIGGNNQGGNLPASIPGFSQYFAGNSDKPYGDAAKTYQPYLDKATNAQNPFANLGKTAIPQFQDYLSKMQDPTAFVNHIMQNYQQSPWAQNLMTQSTRAANNAGSADGTYGSTPWAQQLQQNAGQIASADQNNWLQNVLQTNKTYGEGVGKELDTGAHANDELSELFNKGGEGLATLKYGQKAGENQDSAGFWAGLSKLLGG